MSVVYGDYIHNDLLAKRQLDVARRCILRKNNKIPMAGEQPPVEPNGTEELELTDDENDEAWLEVIVF